MNKNCEEESGINFIARLINTPGAAGRIGAFQTLCLISKSRALIPEFCSKDILKSLLISLHSADKEIRLYAAIILNNFTSFNRLTDYIDTLDLLRNMIDAFYNTEDLKMLNLLINCFLKLAEHPPIKVAFTDPACSSQHRADRQAVLAAISEVHSVR